MILGVIFLHPATLSSFFCDSASSYSFFLIQDNENISIEAVLKSLKQGSEEMQYSFKCPLCNQSLTIDAETDDEAVEKFLAEGKVHVAEHHPGAASLPEEQLKAMIRFGMKKQETQ